MPADLDLIDASEAADMLGVSLATLHRIAASGDLPTAYKADGIRGVRLFHRADAVRLAAERTPQDAA